MKTAILLLFALSAALMVLGWGIDRFGGAKARASMDAVPVYTLGWLVLAADAGLLVLYALYRLLFT